MAPMEPIERLKAATSKVHRVIESTEVSRAIVSENVTEHDVMQYLACMFACVEAAETAVRSVVPSRELVDEWGYRLQGPELAEDVAKFRNGAALNLPGKLDVTDEPAAIGVLYVLQGSRFGRHMLGQSLRARGVDVASRSNYLRSSGIEPQDWKLFGRHVNARLDSDDRVDAASASAVNCFEMFVEHFAAEPMRNPHEG